MQKELRPMMQLAKEQGWEIVRTQGKHWKWISPTGQWVITPSTPRKGKRSFENTLADLRRAGLKGTR